eukprot:TRINITY_DN4293_c0_g3_i1.p1 TRINITY_DN4293_c0_g3~~TRINITY_DN4293_c0_g3_i1.p1  ORF type:complete len:157 (+),score=46.69 TRINITY_DN4293_c0_g3_i1:136-606(+)
MGKKYDGFRSDIWSCGVILYALVTGKLPFDDDNTRKLLMKVKSGVFAMPQSLGKELQDLISKMLTVDPEQRIQITDILKHPWFSNTGYTLSSLPEHVETRGDKGVAVASEEDIDEEIFLSLRALGWGTGDQLVVHLTSKEFVSSSCSRPLHFTAPT